MYHIFGKSYWLCFDISYISLDAYIQNELLSDEETREKVKHAVSIITFSLCLTSVVLLLIALSIFQFFK